MMSNTKLIAIALTVLLLLGLAGCSDDNALSSSSSSSSSITTSSSESSHSLPSAPSASSGSSEMVDSSGSASLHSSTGALSLAPSGESSEPDRSLLAAAQPTYDPSTLPNDRLEWGQGVQFNDLNQPINYVSNQQAYG